MKSARYFRLRLAALHSAHASQCIIPNWPGSFCFSFALPLPPAPHLLPLPTHSPGARLLKLIPFNSIPPTWLCFFFAQKEWIQIKYISKGSEKFRYSSYLFYSFNLALTLLFLFLAPSFSSIVGVSDFVAHQRPASDSSLPPPPPPPPPPSSPSPLFILSTHHPTPRRSLSWAWRRIAFCVDELFKWRYPKKWERKRAKTWARLRKININRNRGFKRNNM